MTSTNSAATTDATEFDESLFNEEQKANFMEYVNEIQRQKRSIEDELNQLKLSSGPLKRRRTKRTVLANSISLPTINTNSSAHLSAMLQTLIYIVQEMNVEQMKLTTTMKQLTERIQQNEFYLNQLNANIEHLYEQIQMKEYSQLEIEPIVPTDVDEPIDMSTTSPIYSTTKTNEKSTLKKEYIELGDPSIGLSCRVLKRKYDQVRRRTELAYIHGEKRAIGRLLTFLIRQFFSNDELRNASLDGRVRNTQALAEDRMSIIDKHLQTIFGIDYNLYRVTKDCAEQVNVVCRHARNPKNSTKIERENSDDYETYQETLFIQANEERFHQLAQEYERVRTEVEEQRTNEKHLRDSNERLQNDLKTLEEHLKNLQQNEQQYQTKWQNFNEQLRQISSERDQLKTLVDEKEKEIYALQKQRESLEEENRQVHQTNSSTIARLQELESTSTQLQSLENLWAKERQLYGEQLHNLEQSLIEAKKLSIEQQTKIMQMEIQFETQESQIDAQKRSLDMGIRDKDEKILDLDRQLREKSHRIEQLELDLRRLNRQIENEQTTNQKNIQSLKNQLEELSKKNGLLNEKNHELNQNLANVTSERDVIKNEMRVLTETFEKQSVEHEQTIRRLQDELDNTTQLLESIRSKGADLTQLTNFLDGTLSHIRSSDTTNSTVPTPSLTSCAECRQLKSALVLELTGKERYRFGYEQLSSMIKEAAPILRRQKQDYEASFEVIGKLTSELNEARKELSDLHQMSGESIENYRYIQRENQNLLNDNKSLATKIQVLLAEIEELRTGKRPSHQSESSDPNQEVPLTFRNVVELQHVNQKLDKMLRELRTQSEHNDEDLNRQRFEELKRDHQIQQEKFKETKNELDSLRTQIDSLIQERDFLRLLVSRSSSSQSSSTPIPSVIDTHQIENLRDQIQRCQEKIEQLTKKNSQLNEEKDEFTRSSNEKLRSLQFELLSARTEIEQNNEKLNLISEERSTDRLTIDSLRTEINGWQQRHSTLNQIRMKQEQQYFAVLSELRQLKEEKNSLELRLNTLENEKKFEAIKFEQIENECLLLKNELVKNEQIQPIIEKLQILAEQTKEKTQLMFEAKIKDLTMENEQLKQRCEQIERERELIERTNQTRLDEFSQNLQEEKNQHQQIKTKYLGEKERADQLQRQLNEFETKFNANSTQKTDFEQQLGNYEKEIKMLKVKLDAANNELELRQTLIQSSSENVNQLNLNEKKALEELERIKQDFQQRSVEYENDIEQLKKEVLHQQSVARQNDETIEKLNERIVQLENERQTELTQSTERYEQLTIEKNLYADQLERLRTENDEFKEQTRQFQLNIDEQQLLIEDFQRREKDLNDQLSFLQNEQTRLTNDVRQFENSLAEKEEILRIEHESKEQLDERYRQLEEKHREQHATMIKLSTHLAARESEILAATTTDPNAVNESWNAILTMNNYLKVENARLTDDVERIRMENAQIAERNQRLEQNHLNDRETIEDLKTKIESLAILQNRFDQDQILIGDLHEKCRLYEEEKSADEQNRQRMQQNLEELNQQKTLLNDQLKQSDEKRHNVEEQLNNKAKELEEQGRQMNDVKSRVTKLEAENHELEEKASKLRALALRYRSAVNAAAKTPATTTATAATTAPTSGETDDLENPNPETDANKNRTLPTDLTEKMNKFRDALFHARSTMATQQARVTQLTTELAKAKQSQISTDLTEVHSVVENIRQTYESEINDFRHILQLFECVDVNEHMAEILRLRKRVDELTATKPSAASTISSTTSKTSEDVTPKPARPQAFASPMTQEPAITRVAPIAPATGRQIGVAIPMTASSTPTTSSAPLWTDPIASATQSSSTSATAAPIEHSTQSTTSAPTTTTQLTTAAGLNLFTKRTRTDEGDQRSTDSTTKRLRPETESAPLIAHVEPQVREQQTTVTISEPMQESIETNLNESTRTDISTSNVEADSSFIGDNSTTESNVENRSTSSSIVVTAADLNPNPNETVNVVAPVDQSNEPRRGDILPIVYDVQTIPTIGSGSNQAGRPFSGRSRPFINPTRRISGGGRGAIAGRGGRGLGGAGPSSRP